MTSLNRPRHSHRSRCRRSKTHSPYQGWGRFFEAGSGKQSPNNIFTTPSPIGHTQLAKSVPAERKQQAASSPYSKRGRTNHSIDFDFHTPTNEARFFSSPRCPPSPHHKTRPCSPLRMSAVSPIVVINRPHRRQPLAELAMMIEKQGLPHRTASKDFKLYTDTGPFEGFLQATTPLSHGKSNNKENVPPFQGKSEMQIDPFVRSRPRGPLTRLKRSDQAVESDLAGVIDVKRSLLWEETITTKHLTGTKVMSTISQSNDIQPLVKAAEFQIHQDTVEYQDVPSDHEFGSTVWRDIEDDKENIEPKFLFGSADKGARWSRGLNLDRQGGSGWS